MLIEKRVIIILIVLLSSSCVIILINKEAFSIRYTHQHRCNGPFTDTDYSIFTYYELFKEGEI